MKNLRQILTAVFIITLVASCDLLENNPEETFEINGIYEDGYYPYSVGEGYSAGILTSVDSILNRTFIISDTTFQIQETYRRDTYTNGVKNSIFANVYFNFKKHDISEFIWHLEITDYDMTDYKNKMEQPGFIYKTYKEFLYASKMEIDFNQCGEIAVFIKLTGYSEVFSCFWKKL